MAVEMLTVLSPVQLGEETPLRKTLQAVKGRDASPFDAVPGTHTARWVVLQWVGTGDPTRRRRLRPAVLLFSAVVDGPVESWLWGLLHGVDGTAEEVWSHCSGWPGADKRPACARWLLDHRLPLTFEFLGYDATVDEITHGLELRHRLADFAVRARDLEPDQLRTEYEKHFPSTKESRR